MSYKLQILADVAKAFVQPFIVNHQCIICHTKLGGHLHSIKRHVERGHPVLATEIKAMFDMKQIPIAENFDLIDPKYTFRHHTSSIVKSFSEERPTRKSKSTPLAVVTQNTEQGLQAMDKLIKMFLSSSVSLLSLNNASFVALMQLIDGFNPPTVTEFTKILKSHVQMAINLAVTEIILSDLYYSVSVDISNESLNKLKFVGITLHYYSEVSNEVKIIAIDLRKCNLESVQVQDVVTRLLTEFNLSLDRLVRIVIGSGRMKKAVFQHIDSKAAGDNVEFIDDDDEDMDSSNTDKVMESINNILNTNNNCLEPIAEGCLNLSLMNDSNLEHYVKMLQHTETKENTGSGLIGNHFTCALYRLQQVCEVVFERFEPMTIIRDKVLELLSTFATHPASVSYLRTKFDASLSFPANRQWTSMEKVFSQIIKIKVALNNYFIEQNGRPFLTDKNLRLMEVAVAFLLPFNQYMTVLQRPTVPTLSLLFTGLSHLIVTLKNLSFTMCKEDFALNVIDFAASLCTEIKIKFADVLSPEPNADPIFIAASALDATVASFLLSNTSLTVVRNALIKCIQMFQLGNFETSFDTEVKPFVVNPFGFGPSIQVNKPPPMENTVEKEVEYLIYLIQNKQWNCAKPFDLFEPYNLTTLKQLAFVLASVPVTATAVNSLFTKMNDMNFSLSNKTEANIFKVRCIGSFNMQQ